MKKLLLFSLLLITAISFGQRKYFADRYFEEFAYKKSAELYENIYKKGDSSVFVLSRIGDSYYNNSDYANAEQWYEKLLSADKEEVASEYIFKYAQTLKSNGKVTDSDDWLLKLESLAVAGSRSNALVENEDYFATYSNKKTSYLNINNISTNTEYSDFGGFIYEDALYFASTKPYLEGKKEKLYQWNKQPFLNVYKAQQKATGDDNVLDVEASERISAVNSKYHESNAIFSKDGNTMYFTRDNYDGKKLRKDNENTVHLKIYKSVKENDEWVNVTELPFNSNDYSVGHPALSPDEKTLYFVSDMVEGFGLTDIYKVAVLNDHKEYGVPENLGKTINTEGKEMFPYVDKNNTMYFSSNGHLGLGALDVFESKLENNQFTPPVNLGKPINSPLDDFSFVINEELTNGYFSSNREDGKGDDDIYSFQLVEKPAPIVPEVVEPELEPVTCTQVIAGTVRSKHDNSPLQDATVTLVDSKGKILEEMISKADGTYTFDLLTCDVGNYSLKGEKLDFKPDVKTFQTKQVTNKSNITKIDLNLSLTPLIIGDQIVISPIYFDFDKSNIREDAKYELEHILTVMNNHPEMIIRIESHTDSRGSSSYNRLLSDRRSKSTRDYIFSRGIDRSRIVSAIGFGEDKLLNHCDDANKYNCSEEEHQLNRRSYFYIISGADSVRIEGQ